MMNPKQNNITNHLFILPDTQNEYLRHFFTKYLEFYENFQKFNICFKLYFMFLDRKAFKFYEYT